MPRIIVRNAAKHATKRVRPARQAPAVAGVAAKKGKQTTRSARGAPAVAGADARSAWSGVSGKSGRSIASGTSGPSGAPGASGKPFRRVNPRAKKQTRHVSKSTKCRDRKLAQKQLVSQKNKDAYARRIAKLEDDQKVTDACANYALKVAVGADDKADSALTKSELADSGTLRNRIDIQKISQRLAVVEGSKNINPSYSSTEVASCRSSSSQLADSPPWEDW